MMLPRFVVHLLSGGIDSVCLLYEELQDNCKVHCVGMNYGQRHLVELNYARKHCLDTDTPFTEVALNKIDFLFKHSALTDGEGSNIVPNRNAIFLHIAAGIAASQGAECVTIACNKDDQKQFPDCRPEFIEAMNRTLKAAEINVEICAPYIDLTKKQIVERAQMNDWPWFDTVSCYNGNSCGKCDACIKRNEACGIK